MTPSLDPDPDTEPEADDVAGVDADESANREVLTSAALIRHETEEYEESSDSS